MWFAVATFTIFCIPLGKQYLAWIFNMRENTKSAALNPKNLILRQPNYYLDAEKYNFDVTVKHGQIVSGEYWWK